MAELKEHCNHPLGLQELQAPPSRCCCVARVVFALPAPKSSCLVPALACPGSCTCSLAHSLPQWVDGQAKQMRHPCESCERKYLASLLLFLILCSAALYRARIGHLQVTAIFVWPMSREWFSHILNGQKKKKITRSSFVKLESDMKLKFWCP